MSQIQPQFCRERAVEMRRLADRAPSEDVRACYLELSTNWLQLAEEVEGPFRWRRAQPR